MPAPAKAGVEAMGGRLALVAEHPSRPRVRIKGSSMLADGSGEPDEPDRAPRAQHATA